MTCILRKIKMHQTEKANVSMVSRLMSLGSPGPNGGRVPSWESNDVSPSPSSSPKELSLEHRSGRSQDKTTRNPLGKHLKANIQWPVLVTASSSGRTTTSLPALLPSLSLPPSLPLHPLSLSVSPFPSCFLFFLSFFLPVITKD